MSRLTWIPCALLLLGAAAYGQPETRVETKNTGLLGGLEQREEEQVLVEAPAATENEDPTKLQQLGTKLLVLGQEQLEQAAYDGVKLEQRFQISKYLHLGVGGGLHALEPKKQTTEQKLALERADGPAAWVVVFAEGGARVPVGTSLPVGPATLQLGFTAGAKARYAVTQLTPLPDGVKKDDLRTLVDSLKALGKRTYDLPLDAATAEALPAGSRTVVEGQRSVAFSGSLRLGHQVTDFGDGVIRIGASARIGGFYRVVGDLRTEVYRLAGPEVRLRVTRVKSRSRGASADLFLGASVDRAKAKQRFEPLVEYFDTSKLLTKAAEAGRDAAVGQVAPRVEKAIKFAFSARTSRSDRDAVDVSYRFDLSSEQARLAYTEAVRGNCVLADQLGREPESGVVLEFRVLELEQRHHRSAQFTLSVLAAGKWSRDVRTQDLDVEAEGQARTHYELFTFNKRMQQRLIGEKAKLQERRKKEFVIDAVRRTREGILERSFAFRYAVKDPGTTCREATRLQRIIALWGLDAASSLPTPGSRFPLTRYGKTDTRLSVAFSEEGTEYLLSKSELSLFMAYVTGYEAVHGDVPVWADPAVRQRLFESRRRDLSGAERRAKAQLELAESFVLGVQALARSAAEAEDVALDVENLRAAHEQGEPVAGELALREARLTELRAERAGLLKELSVAGRKGLIGVCALVQLVPRDMIQLEAHVNGKRIAIGDAWKGERHTGTLRVDDPRGGIR